MKLQEFKVTKWGLLVYYFVIITTIPLAYYFMFAFVALFIMGDIAGHEVMVILQFVFGGLGVISGLLFIIFPIITHVNKNFIRGCALTVGFCGIITGIIFLILMVNNWDDGWSGFIAPVTGILLVIFIILSFRE